MKRALLAALPRGTNGAMADVRSAAAQHVLEETCRTFADELKQLRVGRSAWK